MLRRVMLIGLFLSLILTLACQVSIPEVALLEVNDQAISGNSVNISRVDMDKPGWLVIHLMGSEGQPNTSVSLINAYLVAGKYKNINLPLATNLIGELTVVATLYYDEPADKQFDPETGDPPVMVGGNQLVQAVTLTGAQVTPTVEVESQDVTDYVVTISRIIIDKPGWVVLHPATSEGQPNTAVDLSRGHISIPGEYVDLQLPVIGTLTGERTIFAMLHYDDPFDGEFTFDPGNNEDVPVTVNGEIVVQSFTARG